MLEVCKPLRKLMSSKMTWTWNASSQQLFDKAKSLIKAEMCMKFYDDTKPLYLETDVSGIGLEQQYYNLGTTWAARKTVHQTTLSFAQLHL